MPFLPYAIILLSAQLGTTSSFFPTSPSFGFAVVSNRHNQHTVVSRCRGDLPTILSQFQQTFLTCVKKKRSCGPNSSSSSSSSVNSCRATDSNSAIFAMSRGGGGGGGEYSLSDLDQDEWKSMKEFRERTDYAKLCTPNPTVDEPRITKNEIYGKSVLETWRAEIGAIESKSGGEQVEETMGRSVIYHAPKYDEGVKMDDADNTDVVDVDNNSDDDTGFLNSSPTQQTLCGHMVVPKKLLMKAADTDEENNTNQKLVPGIIFFHTGAGVQDIFLRWRAETLAREIGGVVLIADLLGDTIGWTWGDRPRYWDERCALLEEIDDIKSKDDEDDEDGKASISGRWRLRTAISAALDVLQNIKEVDSNNIIAMGWCLGGQPIIEMGRMQCQGVKTLISFHGVFDKFGTDSTAYSYEMSKAASIIEDDKNVLICAGEADPYAKDDEAKGATQILERNGWNVELIQYEGCKHSFTHPYQVHNDDEAFDYDEDANISSWNSAIKLIQENMSIS